MRPANNVIDEISFFSNQEGNDKNQYLTFILAGEEYGVDILRVQEIKGWEGVTKIPNAPSFVKGVMNLRGSIVPIVDLRKRFGMEPQEYGPTTVVIVLRIEKEEKQKILGIVVDAVSDVYDINTAAMQPAPDFGDNMAIDFIKGLTTVENKMVILLNIDHLLSYSELEAVSRKTANPASPAKPAMDIELLEKSYAVLAPMGTEIVRKFYEELFSRYPETKKLFENVSIKAQESKLLAAIQLVISNLRSPQKLATSLQQLGIRHKDYGANAELYKAVSDTLLDVLKECAGDHWNAALQNAWQGALKNISRTMLEAGS